MQKERKAFGFEREEWERICKSRDTQKYQTRFEVYFENINRV
jgi:hypothetical protein